MDSADSFDLAFVTDDENRKTGGEWITVKGVHKTEFVTKAEQAKMNKAQPRMEVLRNPNHYDNSTRNIVLKNGEVRTVAIRLMRRYNGKTIT